jgi:hypothetical protein
MACLHSLDHPLPVHYPTPSIMASKCIPKFNWSWPPNAAPKSLDLGLQVHLWVRSMSVLNCISKLTPSGPPSFSLSSHDPGLEMHLRTRLINYIVKEWQLVYGDKGVMEVEWVTWSLYLGDSGVDRHHLTFISSCHTMKIPTLSFLTFGLTSSFRDLVHLHNCVVPHG